VIAAKSNVNVFVASDDSAIAAAPMPMEEAPKPVHHRVHHTAPAASGTASSGGNSGSAATASNTPNGTAPVHKVHHHYSSESGSMVYSGPGHNRAWALKQGRMVAVANHFLKGGVPKINVSLQNPPMNGEPSNTIKVVFIPKMDDFNPQMAGSSATR
jgi:hypothetical protein